MIKRINRNAYEAIGILLLSYLSFRLIFNLKLNTTNYLVFIQGDYLMHTSTYFGFLFDDWNFPIFSSEKYFFNKQLNLLWADNNPLYSLLLKIFYSLTNVVVANPATYWLLISYILMGIFSYKLIDELGIESYIFKSIGSLIFLTLPLLPTISLEHYTLQSHWLIVGAFYYFLKSKKNKKYVLHLSALSGLGIMIQVYFFPMIALIYFISLLPFSSRTNLKYSLQSFLILVLFLFAYVFIFWDGLNLFSNTYVANSESIYTSMWSAETNSFFCSQSSFEFINQYLLCYYPYTNENIESYAYLGIGLIFGLFLTIFKIKLLTQFLRENILLIFVSIFFLFLSFGNRFKFFHKQIFEFELFNIQSIFYRYFRAHGRFSYVFYYFIVIFVIYGIYKIFKNNNFATVAIFLILVMQIYDLNHIISNSTLKNFDKEITSVDQYVEYIESYENIYNILENNKENRLYIYPHDNCENDYDKLYLGLQFLKINGSISSFRYRGGLYDENCSKFDLNYILNNMYPNHLAVDMEYIDLVNDIYECSTIKFLYSKDFLYCSK